jgi:hypothetical protein
MTIVKINKKKISYYYNQKKNWFKHSIEEADIMF